MDNTKTLHLNLSMSPRAIDELKQYSNVKYNSKYELPLIMFPDSTTFREAWSTIIFSVHL